MGGRPSSRIDARVDARLLVAVGAVLLGVAALVGVVMLGNPTGGSTGGGETVVHASGGQWTNVTPDRLAQMLTAKDFTLLNVKTPYIGEIEGTDLYIPYDQVAARAAELPTDRAGRIVVYCRSGAESAIAARTLLDLGFTSVFNLDGGMNAWTASGRELIQRDRS